MMLAKSAIEAKWQLIWFQIGLLLFVADHRGVGVVVVRVVHDGVVVACRRSLSCYLPWCCC